MKFNTLALSCSLFLAGCVQVDIRSVQDANMENNELLNTVGEVKIISSSFEGVPGDGYSYGVKITSDGNFAVFCSNSTNLTHDTGLSNENLFRKNLRTGEIILVNKNMDGVPSNGSRNCQQKSISDDGNLVAWESNSTNLVAGVSSTQVYLKNIKTNTIRLVSTDINGVSSNKDSYNSQMTPDGEFVFFITDSTNLVSAVSGQQVYRKNIIDSTIQVVNLNMAGTPANSTWCFDASVDGSSLIFSDTVSKISFFRNITTNSTSIASSSAAGVTSNNSSTPYCGEHMLHNGINVAFTSNASNLGFTITSNHIFVKNILTGTIQIADSADELLANSEPFKKNSGVISRDGSLILFSSTASNLATGFSGNQVYLKNLVNGGITPVSTNISGQKQNAGSNSYYQEFGFAINNRYVVFPSPASNLDPLVTTTANEQIYLKRIQ